jgi:hypothetical protein
VIDNLRYDQWKVFERRKRLLQAEKELSYYSILPTATQYARNAIFSGLLPVEMENSFRNTGKTILKKAVELI